MRIAILAAAVLFAACSRPAPPPPYRAAIEAETQALLKPVPERQPGPLSGFVSARDEKTLSLDSGGQHLVPLKVSARTPTMRDGEKGSVADIREGDVVRAAYSMGPDGAPIATQIVVTSKPFTGRETPPGTNADAAPVQADTAPQAAASQELVVAPAAVVDPRTGEPPVIMEVSPVETRRP
jgi:hypothetical protein